MMNVLTDVLYDSSSLMSSQNFKERLSQNKILSPHDITFDEDQLHQMSVSQIHNIDQTILSNHSGMNFYNSSNQIHLSSNTNAGFDGDNDVSVFSDSFPEIVPSWLTHDFMKASDNLPSPDILSNVSDIYPSTTESEHLEMLDLGFPTELTSQDVASARLDESCISESQKLLVELPIQRFSNNDPLLMTSFNNMTDLNSIQYQKFKHSTHPMSNHASLMTPILPCENNLLHLPLHSSLTDQCLTSTSSPMMSNSQSQSHPVDVTCDKLPQINLNHLDSFLGGKTSLSNIQVLHQDFPNVSISNELNCNQPSQIEDCHPIAHNTTHELLSTNVTLTQDVSIQVSENAFNDSYPQTQACYPCSKVSSVAAIEVIQCFKCKFCEYISMHKCAVESHINSSHSKSPNAISTIRNEIADSRQSPISSITDANDLHKTSKSNMIPFSATLPTFNNLESTIIIPIDGNLIQNENSFQCSICNKLFNDATAYNMHLLTNHNVNHDTAQKNFASLTNKFHCGKCNTLFLDSISYTSHMMSNHNVNLEPVHTSVLNGFLNANANHINIAPVNGEQRILPKDVNQNAKPLNGKKKLLPKESNNNAEEPAPKSVKTVSSRKKAWQKKLKRELGSYICEFKGCNIRFRALDNLEYHKKCHVSGGGSFACPECGMKVENWGTIAGHLWRIHKNDMELHKCDQCPFRHYSLSHLELTHKKIHLSVCSFLCDECGKGFKNGKQMRNHRDRNHLNHPKKRKQKREPKCKICSAVFASRVLLQHHEDTVHNVKCKSYMCNYCDYTAMKRDTLRLHMRQHTGEKPFECDQCEYRTSDHNSLRRHKMIHSGEKQYKCPFCPYSSIQASSYKNHMKIHPGHNGVMFSCEICSFKTVKRDKYIQHVNDHESINMLQNASSMNEINSTEEMYPMAEAMDISLSYGDNNLIFPLNNKNMQSFFNCSGVSMVSVGQESAT